MRTLPTREHERLERALAQSELVVCLGPGVSAAAGLPARAGLVRALIAQARALRTPIGTGRLATIEADLERGADYVRLLGDLERALGVGPMQLALKDVLEDSHHAPPSPELADPARGVGESEAPTPVLLALVRLAPALHLIVDTSLDDLALRALEVAGWLGHWAIGPSSVLQARRVVKVCGVLSDIREKARLTDDDLRQAAVAPRLKAFGTGMLRGRVVLFVGFRADDRLLDWLFQLAPDDGQSTDEGPLHVALVPPAVNAATARRDRERWAARGLSLCTIGDSDDDHLAAVAEVLGQLARAIGDSGARGEEITAAKDDAESAVSPYPGLEVFDEDRAAYFFGREIDVDAVLSKIVEDSEDRRWISIGGPSGVGKSSFVRAGLAAAIRRGQLGGAWADKSWTVVVCRPGLLPFTRLVEALEEELERPIERGDDGVATKDAILAATRAHTGRGGALLLVIDQLEEALTFGDTEERARLAEALATLLREPSLPALVVTTIRSDHLDALAHAMPALGSLLNTHQIFYNLASLAEEGLRAAIVRPSRACGLDLEEALVERILGDAGAIERQAGEVEEAGVSRHGAAVGRPTSSRALPLVAHVLRELWQRRHAGRITRDDYDALGGIARALTKSADALLDGLDDASRNDADNLLLGLVAPIRGDASAFSRKTLALDEAVRLAGGGERGREILARLSGGGPAQESAGEGDVKAPKVRLVATRESGGVTQVDLVHEALLHAWKHMAELLTKRGAERVRTDDLEREAARWAAIHWSQRWLPVDERATELMTAEAETELGREFKIALRLVLEKRRRRSRVAFIAGVTVLAMVPAMVSVAIDYLASRRPIGMDIGAFRDDLLFQGELRAEVRREVRDEVRREVRDEERTTTRRQREHTKELLIEFADDLSECLPPREVRARAIMATDRGNADARADNADTAHGLYYLAVKLYERLTRDRSRSARARARRDLAMALERLADLEVAVGNLPPARALLTRCLSIVEALADGPHTGLIESLRDVSVVLDKLGVLEDQAGNFAQARAHALRSLAIAKTLAQADPASADASFQVIQSHLRFAQLRAVLDDPALVREHLEAAHGIMNAMATKGQRDGHAEWDALRSTITNRLAENQVAERRASRSILRSQR